MRATVSSVCVSVRVERTYHPSKKGGSSGKGWGSQTEAWIVVVMVARRRIKRERQKEKGRLGISSFFSLWGVVVLIMMMLMLLLVDGLVR